MEAVPKLYMLYCELKVSPVNADFSTPLKKYIRSHYQENPEEYEKETNELDTLRQAACKVSHDFTGCSILKRYYSQLILLQNRFPMTDDGSACVAFTWCDVYSGATFSITDIKYEQACMLYNIGALHSKLGALDTRSNAEGMKMTCTHFQCAAWAFHHLRDSYPQPKGSDMSHDILTFMADVMLAQAQECILEKSMLDNRKPSIIAKVAAQVVDYYRCSSTLLVPSSPSKSSLYDTVGTKMFKMWKRYIEFKMSYYASISHFYMGNHCEDQQKMGERVAWYESASEHLKEALRLFKGMDRSDVSESLVFLTDVIGGKHSAAKKENDFVYHEKVPHTENLPEVKGASLVKGISFNPADPDVCGEDIFSRLIPIETHSLSSLYSEEKAKILRSLSAKIEDKNAELSTYMSSLQLDQNMFNEEQDKIPNELVEKCAALSVKPEAVTELVSLMKDLLEISNNVDSALKSCQSLLLDEEKNEKKHQEIHGKRVPSMIVMELKKECSKFGETHLKAAESNRTLQDVASTHISNLKVLTGQVETVEKTLPSFAGIKSPSNRKALDKYIALLKKVDEMKEQRRVLQQQLRDEFLKDDIVNRLIAVDNETNIQSVFQEELKKHSQVMSYIDQNLTAQDNILFALTQANACLADVRKSMIVVQQERECRISSLNASYEAYEDLLTKGKKGLEFYQKLNSNVSRMLDRIRSVVLVQDEERSQRADAERRLGTLSNCEQTKGSKNIVEASSVPKLKDYLPHLQNRKALTVSPMINNTDHLQVLPVRVSDGISCSTSSGQTLSQLSYMPNVDPSMLSQAKYQCDPSFALTPRMSTFESTVHSTPLVPFPGIATVPSALSPYTVASTTSSAESFGICTTSGIASKQEFSVPPQFGCNVNYTGSKNYPVNFFSGMEQTDNRISDKYEKPNCNVEWPTEYTKPSSILIGNSRCPNSNFDNSMGCLEYYNPPHAVGTQDIHPAVSSFQVPSMSAHNTALPAQPCFPYSHAPYIYGSENCQSFCTVSTFTNSPYITTPAGSFQGSSNTLYLSSSDNKSVANAVHSSPSGDIAVQYSQAFYLPSQVHSSASTASIGPPLIPHKSDLLADQSGQYFCDFQIQAGKISENGELSSEKVIAGHSINPSFPTLLKPATENSCVVAKSDFQNINNPFKAAEEPEGGSTKEVLEKREHGFVRGSLAKVQENSYNARDPFEDPVLQEKFIGELEKFEKLVEGLTRKSLNGTTSLDQKWKDLIDSQDKDSQKKSISVARCYPLKNRIPDIMPYDCNRVQLMSSKDDYINASYLKDLAPSSPAFIITQAPLPTTYADFWLMIWEQQVENIICLSSHVELKNHIYWPSQRGKKILHGPLEVSLQSETANNFFTERIISLNHNKNKTSRSVVHVHFTEWQPSGFPSAYNLVRFVSEVLKYYTQQRSLLRPVVVHCSAGVGHSGIFCLVAAFASEVNNGRLSKDIGKVAAMMCQQRKYIIPDKDHLKFSYDAILCYAKMYLKQKGILAEECFSSVSSQLSTSTGSEAETKGSLGASVEMVLGEKMNALYVEPESSSLKSDRNEMAGPCLRNKNSIDTESVESFGMPEESMSSSRDNSVTSILDPTKFTLDTPSKASGKRRITKDEFTAGSLSDSKSSDPFSNLNLLWPLK